MQDKVVIVTGASSGIGRASALLFASRGAKVVAVGRNEKELTSLVPLVPAGTGSIKPHLADVTELSQVERIANDTADSLGRIDALVNSAGIIMNGTIETTNLDQWDKMFNLNVRSVFVLIQKCLPHLIESKGSVVNVSSVAGTRTFPNILAYGVSKSAIDQLTRASALELAAKGVRVNSVNPGVVVTNIHKRGGMSPDDYDAFLERSKETHPMGRVGTADEVAELIYFLASDKAGWITGGNYAIDGGRALTCAR